MVQKTKLITIVPHDCTLDPRKGIYTIQLHQAIISSRAE